MKRLGFLLLPSVVVLGMIWIVFWANPTFAVPPPPPPPPPHPSPNPSFLPTPPPHPPRTRRRTPIISPRHPSSARSSRRTCSSCWTTPAAWGTGRSATAPTTAARLTLHVRRLLRSMVRARQPVRLSWRPPPLSARSIR